MRRALIFIVAAAAVLGASEAAADPDSALRAYKAGLYDVAAAEFKREAGLGDPLAQYWLGLMYLDGNWFRPDRAEAVHWLGMAAIQGFEPALRKLEEVGRGEPAAPPK